MAKAEKAITINRKELIAGRGRLLGICFLDKALESVAFPTAMPRIFWQRLFLGESAGRGTASAKGIFPAKQAAWHYSVGGCRDPTRPDDGRRAQIKI